MYFRRLRKNISLRIVNLIGLSVVFACLLLSTGYIKQELSFDRHYVNADRIVRMTLQFDDQPVDGRIYGNVINDVLQQMPEVERTAKMFKANAILTYQEKHPIINDLYMVNSDFLDVFDIPLLHGDKDEALQRNGQVLISESFARKLFGELDNEKLQMSEITIESRNISDTTVFVSGVFKDIPETSHFRTDILFQKYPCPA